MNRKRTKTKIEHIRPQEHKISGIAQCNMLKKECTIITECTENIVLTYNYYRVHRKYCFDLHCFIGIRNPDWNLWWSLTDFKYKHLVRFSAVIKEMQTPLHSYRSTKVQELLATSILERWKLFGNARMSFHLCNTSASTTFRINWWKKHYMDLNKW